MTTQIALSEIGPGVIHRVRVRRAELRMSARELAEAVTALGLPLSRSTLANLESGRREDPTVTELVAFALALRTTPGELLLAPTCPTCNDAPPAGFTCNACGSSWHPSAGILPTKAEV